MSRATAIHLPPNNVSSENSLLASILLDPQRLDDVADILTADSFYLETNRNLFRAVTELVAKGQAVDAVTACNWLQANGLHHEGEEDRLVHMLNSVPHAAHARYYGEFVADLYARRRLLSTAHDAAAAAHDLATPLDDALAMVAKSLDGLNESRSGGSVGSDLRDCMREAWDSIRMGGPVGVSTGFPGLDDLGCTLKPGSLTVLAARSSTGKTSFAGNLALNLARSGTSVLFVSLEQTRLELAGRFLSCEAGIGNLMNGRTLTDMESNRVCEVAGRLGDLPLVVDDQTPRPVSQIAAVARLTKRRNNLGAVIIDYLQLIAAEDRKLPREQQVAEITKALRNMGRNLGIPVVALAQLNRQIEGRDDKRPKLSDLRESGAIEQDADMVWFLDRPFLYDDKADPSAATLIVRKHRNGKTGDVPLHWNGATMTFSDATADATSTPYIQRAAGF